MPKTNEKYLFYGDFGSEDIAPFDAIVFAFHYIRQDSGFDDYDTKEE